MSAEAMEWAWEAIRVERMGPPPGFVLTRMAWRWRDGEEDVGRAYSVTGLAAD